MTSRISNLMKRHSLVAYFVLACAITWAIGIPLAASVQGLLSAQIPPSVHFLTAYGPMLSALIVTGITSGAAGIREIVGRMLRWRVGIRWILTALFSPVALYLIAAVMLRVWSGSWPDFSRFGSTVEVTGLVWLAGWIFHTLTFGIGEETGWRGFALPRLQKGRSALSATFILSIFWALWHLPMFFYKESFMSRGIPMTIMWFLGLFSGAIVFTWLYNSTGGSILMVALWHGAYNATVTATEETIAAIVSTFVMLAAVIIVLVARPANLSRLKKHTINHMVVR